MHAEKFELLEAKIRETAQLVSRLREEKRQLDKRTSNSASVCMNSRKKASVGTTIPPSMCPIWTACYNSSKPCTPMA